MKKALVLATLLASFAFAETSYSYSYGVYSNDFKKPIKSDRVIFEALSRLDLSNSQIREINSIRDNFFESKGSLEDISSAFDDKSFNEEKYMEILQSKKTNMLKLRAKYITDIYNVLDDNQKSKFKKILDAIYVLR